MPYRKRGRNEVIPRCMLEHVNVVCVSHQTSAVKPQQYAFTKHFVGSFFERRSQLFAQNINGVLETSRI
ncbi:MAG TPA: hypothetical protein PKD64_04300 [Pirellulaceae bacterium]|nr:hypothetical protein [Pirellulaceae bacterium]HMO91394.1 hypothetical protein [Pirellulaceae bacterium]HMP69619.1 hypothetical protein [Pirellulaceae bacterium]